jgi:hypothetical protein
MKSNTNTNTNNVVQHGTLVSVVAAVRVLPIRYHKEKRVRTLRQRPSMIVQRKNINNDGNDDMDSSLSPPPFQMNQRVFASDSERRQQSGPENNNTASLPTLAVLTLPTLLLRRFPYYPRQMLKRPSAHRQRTAACALRRMERTL